MSDHETLFPFRVYDEETATYRLLMEPRTSRYGCGIYEVGQNGLRMFVTDTGRTMAVQGRGISAEDLMEAYTWGRMDAEIQAGVRDPENDGACERPGCEPRLSSSEGGAHAH